MAESRPLFLLNINKYNKYSMVSLESSSSHTHLSFTSLSQACRIRIINSAAEVKNRSFRFSRGKNTWTYRRERSVCVHLGSDLHTHTWGAIMLNTTDGWERKKVHVCVCVIYLLIWRFNSSSSFNSLCFLLLIFIICICLLKQCSFIRTRHGWKTFNSIIFPPLGTVCLHYHWKHWDVSSACSFLIKII